MTGPDASRTDGATPQPQEPVAAGSGDRGGLLEDTAGDFELRGGPLGVLKDLLIFLGAERPPSRALAKIRDVHDLSDWSHRLDIEDAAKLCREAVRDLGRSDYRTWDETALVVSVLSTMATRDPSALVRSDAVRVLDEFGEYARSIVPTLPVPGAATEPQVIESIRILAEAGPDLALETCSGAVRILGDHPWEEVNAEEPAVIRTRLSSPRGIIRLLTAPRLAKCRADPEVRLLLDQALVRLVDQVSFLTTMSALSDRVGHVRSIAAEILADRDDHRAVGPLAVALVAEAEDAVQLSLIAALGRLAGEDLRTTRRAIPALARSLIDPATSVRRAAARELERITGTGLGGDPAAWLRWWRDHAEEYASR